MEKYKQYFKFVRDLYHNRVLEEKQPSRISNEKKIIRRAYSLNSKTQEQPIYKTSLTPRTFHEHVNVNFTKTMSEENLSSGSFIKDLNKIQIKRAKGEVKKIKGDINDHSGKYLTYSDIYIKKKNVMKIPILNSKNCQEMGPPIIERVNPEELINRYNDCSDGELTVRSSTVQSEIMDFDKRYLKKFMKGSKIGAVSSRYKNGIKTKPTLPVTQKNPSMLSTKLKKGSFSYFQFTKSQEKTTKEKTKKIEPNFIQTIPLVESHNVKTTKAQEFKGDFLEKHNPKTRQQGEVARKFLLTQRMNKGPISVNKLNMSKLLDNRSSTPPTGIVQNLSYNSAKKLRKRNNGIESFIAKGPLIERDIK